MRKTGTRPGRAAVDESNAREGETVVRHELAGSLPLTKYHRIYLVLKQQLEEGLHAQGFPPEMELARQFGVGRVTVRYALKQLADEGLIVRTAGRGTRPTSRAEQAEKGKAVGSLEHPSTRLGGLLGDIVQMSRSTSIKVHEWRLIHASETLAQALQIPAGSQVRKLSRTRSTPAGPVSFITSYLPLSLVENFSRADVAQFPILELLEKSGIELGRARQTVSAKQADATVAHQLNVTIGAALLSVRRLVFDIHNRPVQFLHGLYRPDRYEYQMELSQVGGIEAHVVPTELAP